ncbi:hypothetical protein [Yersinia mollaretii]|uniref:hypothetical protein n=1 Tax=Yersinia mollaretii TaxID=33060 RepID=UPI0012D49422|nr:hypothetical protein [Yersinia mollaretii]
MKFLTCMVLTLLSCHDAVYRAVVMLPPRQSCRREGKKDLQQRATQEQGAMTADQIVIRPGNHLKGGVTLPEAPCGCG